MKTPEFWHRRTVVSLLLLPFAWLYQLGYRLRRLLTRPTPITVPIICVGNLVAGGAGKTPVALAIGTWAKAQGIHACFLSRGYGGKKTRGATLVNPSFHPYIEVGDEPLLLANVLPTIVAKSREEGARFAEKQGYDLIIMDDGFQNPHLAADISLVVIDASYGLGNGYTLPAGPLRESAEYGLARATAVVLLSREGETENAALTFPEGLPVLAAHLSTVCNAPIAGKPVLAFSGIARPEQFFHALEQVLGANILQTRTFPDHHNFTPSQLAALAQDAMLDDASLVTTAKDAVRLPTTMRKQVLVADLSLSWQDSDRLNELLHTHLPSPTAPDTIEQA